MGKEERKLSIVPLGSILLIPRGVKNTYSRLELRDKPLCALLILSRFLPLKEFFASHAAKGAQGQRGGTSGRSSRWVSHG